MDDRRDDWRYGVDENLASLNAGQRVWERDLLQIRKMLADVDGLLRGDPKEDTDGLMARLHSAETDIRLLRAAVFNDAAGNFGLQGRVEKLEGGERTAGERWKFATAMVVALLSLFGLILTNWDQISKYLTHWKVDPVERMIEDAKRQKPRYRHVIRIREIPQEETDSPASP